MRAFHLCSGRLPWQIEFGRLIRPTCIFVGSLWLASLTLCAWQGIRRWQSFDQHLRRLNDKVWSCVKVVGSRRFNRWSTRFKTDMRKLAQLRSCAAWPLSSSQYRPSPLCWGHHQQSEDQDGRAKQSWAAEGCVGFVWLLDAFGLQLLCGRTRDSLISVWTFLSPCVRKEALSSISSTNLVNFVLRVLFRMTCCRVLAALVILNSVLLHACTLLGVLVPRPHWPHWPHCYAVHGSHITCSSQVLHKFFRMNFKNFTMSDADMQHLVNRVI